MSFPNCKICSHNLGGHHSHIRQKHLNILSRITWPVAITLNFGLQQKGLRSHKVCFIDDPWLNFFYCIYLYRKILKVIFQKLLKPKTFYLLDISGCYLGVRSRKMILILISQPKDMLWVFKRTVSMRRLF